MSETTDLILKVEGVSRRFGGIQALDNVDFDVRYGEVHALVGENGAGKSTLMNVLGGIVQRESGKVTFKNQEVDFHSPLEAIGAGIAVIHQELAMMPHLNVIENVYMGRLPSRFGRVHWKQAEADTRRVLAMVGLKIDPYLLVNDLSISQRQLVEIAKALSVNASLLIMDEPNSSLSDTETERLFAVIKQLQQQNVAIIYVSHKIEEVLRIANRISVMRDGRYTGTLEKSEASVDRIIQMMVGRELYREPEDDRQAPGPLRLEVRGLCSAHFHDISFSVHAGEVVGLAGLVGAGRSEVARAIFGADPYTQGELILEGRRVRFKHPSEAIAHGLAMVPEDRKLLSLFMDMPIIFNIMMAELPRKARLGVVNQGQVTKTAEDFVSQLSIKLGSLDHPVRSLSGGNQQKTTLARWLATKPRLLILDEPTHGVDVGAKAEIYALIRVLAREGISVLLISSELPEILTMCDRVVVMHEGQVTGVLSRQECSQETIMKLATGFMKESQGAG